MKFKDRVAVVTGGAGYIGSAIVRQLSEAGVAVAMTDVALKKAQTFARSLPNVKAFFMDVQSTAQVQTASREIIDAFGHVDIVINNAGVWRESAFSDMTEEEWNQMIDLNLNSVFRVTKAFLPNMLDNGYGRIINIASIAGETGIPHYCGYSASKAGVIMLTKVLAMELATKNITVNSVSPGMIGPQREPTKYTWLGRRGTGGEVADLVMFLASDGSSFITGADYTIDGGRTLGPHGN